jgi:hypothetical protein
LIVADTGALYAYYNERDPAHELVETFVDRLTESLVVSPYVLAELDYLVGDRMGVTAELGVLAQFVEGAYDVPAVGQDDIAVAVDVIAKYADQQVGLADASIVVLADRYKTKEVLTLDRRHFEVLRPLSGGRFKVLP